MTLDIAVFELITSHNINIAVLLGGGYQVRKQYLILATIYIITLWNV